MPGACSTLFRSFDGPEGTELAILCEPRARAGRAVAETAAAYEALLEVLHSRGGTTEDLERETLFLRDIRGDLPVVLEARARTLSTLGQHAGSPSPAFIRQAPADSGACLTLAASASIPRDRGARQVRDVQASIACPCDGCARSAARIVRLGDLTSLHATNVYGAGADAFEQAWNTFCAAERLLEDHGMRFDDVVRTWIHLRDIDRDYGALNRARREFFQSRGIGRRPASTGVQGGPFPAEHDVAMSFSAVRGPGALDATVMSTPSLNEAWSYGADFSRGLRLAQPNLVTLHVSGTASIDEAGRTVHVGDFQAQAERMLHNIELLLGQQGATFAHLVSGVAYLKSTTDAPALRALFRARGFDGFPCALVEAPLCRPELLCETECVAMLPLAAGGA